MMITRKRLFGHQTQSISDKNYLPSLQGKILVHRCYNVGVIRINNQKNSQSNQISN